MTQTREKRKEEKNTDKQNGLQQFNFRPTLSRISSLDYEEKLTQNRDTTHTQINCCVCCVEFHET